MTEESAPLFSIGITAYNVQPYLESAIRSALHQSYRSIEVVVVDDGSTDGSAEIAATLSDEDSRVTLIRQPHAGYGAALKTAVETSTGSLFGILDGDDVLFSRAVERVVAAFSCNPTKDFVWTQFVRSDGILGHSAPPPETGSLLDHWPCGHFRAFRQACYDRSARLDPAVQAAVDRDLFGKLEEVGEGMFLDETLYFYRIQPNGISESRREEQRAFERSVLEQARERRKS